MLSVIVVSNCGQPLLFLYSDILSLYARGEAEVKVVIIEEVVQLVHNKWSGDTRTNTVASCAPLYLYT